MLGSTTMNLISTRRERLPSRREYVGGVAAFPVQIHVRVGAPRTDRWNRVGDQRRTGHGHPPGRAATRVVVRDVAMGV